MFIFVQLRFQCFGCCERTGGSPLPLLAGRGHRERGVLPEHRPQPPPPLR